MRKIFTLLILLLLLPVTALAAAPNGQVIYVGNVNVTSGGYWTTDSNGSVTAYTEGDTPTDHYIHYDTTKNTLTLYNATIKESVPSDTSTYVMGAGIGVFNLNDASKLTIKLEGSNAIENVSTGIFVLAQSSSTGDATLTITGSGSLDASGSLNGIMVQSNSGDATLTIQSADVTLTSNSGNGVTVQAGSAGTQGHTATLTVNGGKLTASGAAGIQFNASNSSYDITTELTVSGNALVDTRNGGIEVYGTGAVNTTADDDATNGGIVFDGKDGTVYGDVTLDESLTINQGETLTVPDGSSLNCNGKLTNNGTIIVKEGGKLEGEPGGTVVSAPTIGTQPANQTVTEGNTATFTVAATGGNLSYQWQQSTDSGQNWTDISGANAATYTTAATTTSMNGYQYRCVVINSAGSVTSNAVTLTVNAATVSVTGVTLEPTSLSLFTGNTATLTATVHPDNATNQNVTWSSDKPEVATVDNGKVTAVGAGEATITVTTEDGSKTATCQVTVLHSNLKYFERKEASCTEPGNIEYWYCEGCNKYFSDEAGTTEIKLEDVVIPATGHHYVNGYCTKCGHRDPDYRPDPISYYNIYVEDVCDGVEVSTSKQVVREGGSINVYVEKDTARYTFDNFKVYYKRSYYGGWKELKEGTQPGEYPIKNIWTHIYIKAEGAEEKEDPTGIESIEGVKVYTKDGSLYVQTPQREQIIIVSMSGAVVKNEEQIGLKQYHGLQPGIYIVRVGDRAYKVRLH